MPVLVEVQQHLSRLPETIETLGDGIDRCRRRAGTPGRLASGAQSQSTCEVVIHA